MFMLGSNTLNFFLFSFIYLPKQNSFSSELIINEESLCCDQRLNKCFMYLPKQNLFSSELKTKSVSCWDQTLSPNKSRTVAKLRID